MEGWEQGATALLRGSRLVSVGRTLDMIEFHFLDADDRGIALHVQCPCRLRHGNRVLLGRSEALHVAGRHRFDARSQVLNSFLDGLSDMPEVQIATTRSHGDLTIECSGG